MSADTARVEARGTLVEVMCTFICPNYMRPSIGRLTLALYLVAIYDTKVTIQSFKCSETATLHKNLRVARFVNIEAVARRKLVQLNAAASLDFLRVPPGNRLETLKGNRAGQHSVRINDQFRVCFVWTPQGPANVEIVDYH